MVEPDQRLKEPTSSRPLLQTLLCNRSYFSFGAGTASPTTLVQRAAALGYRSLALTDRLNLSGAVELHAAAKDHNKEHGEHHHLKPLIGATVPVRLGHSDVVPLVLLATTREGYGRLAELITQALARETEDLPWPVLLEETRGLACLSGGRDGLPARLLGQRRVEELRERMLQLKEAFPGRCYLQLFHERLPWDGRRARVMHRFAQELDLPAVVAPEVRYARREDHALYDALICARLGISVDTPHPQRPQNDGGTMVGPQEMWRRLPFVDAIEASNGLAEGAHFDLLPDRLKPPAARSVPPGLSPTQHLIDTCWEALPRKYENASPDLYERAGKILEKELRIIEEHDLAEFFLVAAEVTDYCRKHKILAAGRGSAAASVCCYLLGIIKIDPVEHDLLFERFLHSGMNAMPDVDIDISSSRRKQVIEWVEERFGADRAEAMVCNKIRYSLPSAVQDLARALGIPPEQRDRLTHSLGRDFRGYPPLFAKDAWVVFDEVLGEAPAKEMLIHLLTRIERGHVRHISPHSGGVVLSRGPLTHYAPLQRSTGGIEIIQLNKDDAKEMGLIKLDLLGLRMLSALEHARDEIFRVEGEWIDLEKPLPDDEGVWDLISSGQTMGLFQVESPSQVQVSKTMKSRDMKDLAHQIALIRPGPIQSGTVHPYLERHQDKSLVDYLHPKLEQVLGKSLGVLLFQDDVMRIAVHFAGMDWFEAHQFTKKVSGFGELGDIEPQRQQFLDGARKRSHATPEQAQAVFNMVKGYQGFGFTESHAWAFAMHAYASAWLRLHYPAAHLAGLMSQGPGMWPLSTMRQEAHNWKVPFLPLDINLSDPHIPTVHEGGIPEAPPHGRYRVELTIDRQRAIRPSLFAIKGARKKLLERILDERLRGPYLTPEDAFRRVPGSIDDWTPLVRAGVFDSLAPRRDTLYQLGLLGQATPAPTQVPLFSTHEPGPTLAPLSQDKELEWDHEVMRYSTSERHVMDTLRSELEGTGAITLWQVNQRSRKTRCTTAGYLIARQKPPTAKGFAFFVIEDGPTRAQLIISPDLWEQHRIILRDAGALIVDVIIEDTGHQLALRVLDIRDLPTPFRVRGYHFG